MAQAHQVHLAVHIQDNHLQPQQGNQVVEAGMRGIHSDFGFEEGRNLLEVEGRLEHPRFEVGRLVFRVEEVVQRRGLA